MCCLADPYGGRKLRDGGLGGAGFNGNGNGNGKYAACMHTRANRRVGRAIHERAYTFSDKIVSVRSRLVETCHRCASTARSQVSPPCSDATRKMLGRGCLYLPYLVSCSLFLSTRVE